MSERGHFRGGGGRGSSRGGGGRDRGGGQDRGGRGGRDGGGQSNQQQEKPKKENILDLTKYMHKEVQVKFNGGREGEISRSTRCTNRLTLNSCGYVGRL